MHTVATTGSPSLQPGALAPAKVAVAGATGYTGQELLRLLARHPSVVLTAALSSGTTARKLPALATLLALTPLAAAGLLVSGTDVVVDAKSGVSGAGKTPSERTHFSECHGSLAAYGVFGHRHGAEIEQGLSSASGGDHALNFVPHL